MDTPFLTSHSRRHWYALNSQLIDEVIGVAQATFAPEAKLANRAITDDSSSEAKVDKAARSDEQESTDNHTKDSNTENKDGTDEKDESSDSSSSDATDKSADKQSK